jgi:hypothetical protein
MHQDLLYQIGITLVKGIGNVIAKQVIETLGDASLLFKEKARLLERIPGISRRIIAEIHRPEVLQRAEKEVSFIEKNKIIPLFIKDGNYPQRMKECIDAPIILYFRGNASDLVIQDIDDAIDFALSNFNCDIEKIYVIGGSGGGYAALASFMKSKHNVAEFSAWCPISDIYRWYYQTKVRDLNYWEDISKCTNSPNEQLNEISAKSKSPLYWKTPTQKLTTTKLKIYTGVYD